MTATPSLKSLRDQPFELLAELERRGRAVSAQIAQESPSARECVGVALKMAGELYLVAREETREATTLRARSGELISHAPSLTRRAISWLTRCRGRHG